ncbi:hypothetical protein KR054_011772 [Drosophila jambulina]|nr:hypothetical protein KR054_011772 [Drosophila jambulina]
MAGRRAISMLLLGSLISGSFGSNYEASSSSSNSSNSSGGNTSSYNSGFASDHSANDSMEYDAESVALERIVSTIVPVFFGIIGFAGLLGNGLVILVVVANQQMRSTTNLLIINLAVSDILFVIFCVPFTATDYVLPEWPFGNVWCKFVQYMIVVTCHCSVYTLVLMSFDRFLAVVHPVTSMSLRTERNATLNRNITATKKLFCKCHSSFLPIPFPISSE